MGQDPLIPNDLKLLSDQKSAQIEDSNHLLHLIWAINALARHHCFIERDHHQALVEILEALDLVPKLIRMSLEEQSRSEASEIPNVEKWATAYLLMLNISRLSGYSGESDLLIRQLNEIEQFLSHPEEGVFRSFPPSAQGIFDQHLIDLKICLTKEFLTYLAEKISKTRSRLSQQRPK